MVGTLYDASLDALFSQHSFPSLDSSYPTDSTSSWIDSEIVSEWEDGEEVVDFESDGAHWQKGFELDWHFDHEVMPKVNRDYTKAPMVMEAPGSGILLSGGVPLGANPITAGNRSGDFAISRGAIDSIINSSTEGRPFVAQMLAESETPVGDDLAQKSSIRRNLHETAFFLPHLVSGDDGIVSMEFTMPDAVTEEV